MRTGHRVLACAAGVLVPSMLASTPVRADEPQPQEGAQVDLTKDTKAQAPSLEEPTAPPPEAPPPAPYKKSFVLDSSIGAMGFLGQFGKVAPWGPWLHTQLGYELLKWLMIFGEGELAFTDTSNKQSQPATRAFPIYGFGGGARFSIRFTDRFGIYVQGSIGLLKADVGTGVLGILGFHDAESLGLYAGARLGIEWFQIDRHFALGVTSGIRSAQGFAQTGRTADTPLALDGGVSLRYAF